MHWFVQSNREIIAVNVASGMWADSFGPSFPMCSRRRRRSDSPCAKPDRIDTHRFGCGHFAPERLYAIIVRCDFGSVSLLEDDWSSLPASVV